jgi:hypothetical protein
LGSWPQLALPISLSAAVVSAVCISCRGRVYQAQIGGRCAGRFNTFYQVCCCCGCVAVVSHRIIPLCIRSDHSSEARAVPHWVA